MRIPTLPAGAVSFLLIALGLMTPLLPGTASAQEIRIGIDYSPYREGLQPSGPCPTQKEIEQDLDLLARTPGLAPIIRTYGILDCDLSRICAAARKAGLRVVLGAWLDRDRFRNFSEVETLIQVANRNRDVVLAVVVGNDVLARGDLGVTELVSHLARVRSKVSVPVTTGDSWIALETHAAALRPHIDFVFPNVHPYREGVCASSAAEFVIDKSRTLAAAFPGRRVVIGETGWPTRGETLGCAIPSEANQAIFLADLARRASADKLHFFLFEAFDQAWKMRESGIEAEGYFGLYDAKRKFKHQ